MSASAVAVGGRIFTRRFTALGVLAAVAGALILWRFVAGLGSVTGMSDGYPFGLWIAFDVVTGTALACGGYAMALIVYVLNRGHYHPLVRPAILTSLLGYTLAGFSVMIDIGRPWLVWKVPLMPWRWNGSSVMLEVALCVMAYVAVLWIELAPALLERWKGGTHPELSRLAGKTHAILGRAMPFIVALGLLLPTMHQSSLGSLMLLAETKLPALWLTPMLPLLFLVSCVTMGFAVVVLESSLSFLAFRREPETQMLGSLFTAAAISSVVFLALRFADLWFRGSLADAFAVNGDALLFWAETALLAVPILFALGPRRHRRLGLLFRSAVLLILAGALYRFDVYLIAFDPGAGWAYFPATPEILVTLGLVAAEVMAYVAIVKRFPILAGSPPTREPKLEAAP